MLYRPLGRLGHRTSVVMYGGAALSRVTQEEADRSIAYALEHGVNHFDTAASYGDSEVRLGPWMRRLKRERGTEIFLATKTGERTKAKAAAEIRRSLERLQVDRVDLLQLHAIGDMAELDRATGPGGALEAAVEAQEEGLVGAIGITGHGHRAPAVHLEALRRYDFAAVLTPYNFVLYANPDYRRDFDALAAECARRGVALRVIKAIARGPWPQGAERRYATWYQPLEDQAEIDRAVAFVLSRPEVCALAGPGDIHLLPKVIDAVERFRELSPQQTEELLATAGAYASPFGPF
jgi:aryl-alcohol dehydrogenase-like predicted oxidoreductase